MPDFVILQPQKISPKYRLYIDEVGNADLQASVSNPNHRYLSLTGVIFEIEYINSRVSFELEELKHSCFNSSSDEPLILHRKELVRQKPPFQALQDPLVKARFDRELLRLLQDWNYKVITVVIDKQAHLQRYKIWQAHPYHYCLAIMLERYVKWLAAINAVGDVLAEARGGKEDKKLKMSYQRFYKKGTEYVTPPFIAARLTSYELKLKRKQDNDAGLQIADLIAHPSYRYIKMKNEGVAHPNDFGSKIINILEMSKYHRNKRGCIEGYGRKWLP